MVQTVNISEEELEMINQFLILLETIINEKQQTRIESIIEGEGLEGAIQAFLSMIIANFDRTIARFRIFPRFIKKLSNGKIRIHTSTRVSPNENVDITWTLKHPEGQFQKYVIESINSMTVPIYEETQRERNEIPRLDEKWKNFMRAIEKVRLINRIYVRIKKDHSKNKAKQFFKDRADFEQELNNLFGFLEGPFKVIAYIAVIGMNVEGWKGIILRDKENYKVVFDDYRDLEALESLTTPQKMTEKEYLDLLNFIWKERTKNYGVNITIEVKKDKKRIIFSVKKKPSTIKDKKRLVKGERTVNKNH